MISLHIPIKPQFFRLREGPFLIQDGMAAAAMDTQPCMLTPLEPTTQLGVQHWGKKGIRSEAGLIWSKQWWRWWWWWRPWRWFGNSWMSSYFQLWMALKSLEFSWNLLSLEISWAFLSYFQILSNLCILPGHRWGHPDWRSRGPTSPMVATCCHHCCFSFLSFGSEILPHPKHVWS